MELPSQLFYESTVTSKVDESSMMSIRVNGKELSTIFIDISGAEEKTSVPNSQTDYFSYVNRMEIDAIQHIIEKMKNLTFPPCRDEDILLITPYRGQEIALKTRLPHFKVQTTDAVIGLESKVVIVSLVRSEKVGFINVPERLCSTLTRAKEMMILVGNMKLFEKQLNDTLLSKIAKFYKNRELVLTLREFERLQEI
jgi:superfamily I DNA and/or RNA helicase